MKIGSLCTGYAGLDLAVQSALGPEVSFAWYSESDRSASKLLQHRLVGVSNIGDLTTANWSSLGQIDILTGGYPCQPFSNLGKKLGENDTRHLWPYIRNAIRVLRPRISIFENVSAHLARGFSTVLRDCAEDGLSVRWLSLPASAVGAPHRRERLFFTITDPGGEGLQRDCVQSAGLVTPSERVGLADGDSGFDWGRYTDAVNRWESVIGRSAPNPTEPNANGRPRPTSPFYEWMMGLPDGWVTDPALGLPWSQQIKMCGNGVVPAQAELAIRTLLSKKFEHLDTHRKGTYG